MLFRRTFFKIIFGERKIYVISMYFFRPNFDRQENRRFSMDFLSNFDEKQMQVRVADFDLFLKDKRLLSF